MINFVNPRSDFLEVDGMMPPLGLFGLVAVMKKAGYDAQVIDLGLGDMIPDGPLFVTGTTPQLESINKLFGRGYSVLGGPHASVYGTVPGFSLVVTGEGEEVIEHIVKNHPTGEMKTNRIKDLDSLPFPDRTQAHRYEWKIDGEKATTMMTSRGCNGKCSFCCKAVMDKGIYFRSPQNVVDEMIHVKAMGFNAVMFYDDSMAMNKHRLIEICRKARRLNMRWRCFVRSDQVNYMVASEMAKAGCCEVLLGVESGSNRILKNIRKNETVDQHKEAIRLMKKVGIRVKALMIVGLPGESAESIEESKRFLEESRPDDLDVTILSVYPGCHIYTNPDKYELTFGQPTHYKGIQGEYVCTVHTPFMNSMEIIEVRDTLYSTWKKNK